MRLTQWTDYTLRVLMYCAATEGRTQPVTITEVAEGRISAEASPLRHAPHTVEDLVADWTRAYSREQGCFPPASFRVDKYWPPVGRVDNVYGDRHLICTCPPIEAYMDAAE